MGRKAVLVSHIFRDSAAACLDFLVAARDALPTPNVAIWRPGNEAQQSTTVVQAVISQQIFEGLP